jgi:hypothetical protein
MPIVGPDGLPRGSQARRRTDPCPPPGSVNELADKIAALLRADLPGVDREHLRCALLTVAHRSQENSVPFPRMP